MATPILVTGAAVRTGGVGRPVSPLRPFRSGRWRDGLLERRLPVHLANHLAMMADPQRAGRYDRMSEDVFTLTGQRSLGVQEFVRNNAATFTAPSTEVGVSPEKQSWRQPPRSTRT